MRDVATPGIPPTDSSPAPPALTSPVESAAPHPPLAPAAAHVDRGMGIPWHALGVWGALAILLVVASFLSEHFLSTQNVFNILRQASMIAIIALGMTFVIISGGIDLAVGSVVLLCGVLLAGTLAAGGGVATATAVCLGAGLAAGAISGLGVAYLRIPPFVMTLAGMSIYHGAAYIYAHGQPIPIPPEANAALGPIAKSYVADVVPMPVLLVLVLYAAGHVLLNHTAFGVRVQAVGGNEEAARLSGVNTRSVKLAVYMLSGACSAVAAVVLTSRAGTGEILAGVGYELDAIAAVVIGGTSLAGGRGGVWGTLAGTLLLFILLNLFTMLNVHSHYQEVFKGMIIVLAILVQYRRRA